MDWMTMAVGGRRMELAGVRACLPAFTAAAAFSLLLLLLF